MLAVLLRYPPRVDVPEFIGGICPREEDVRACLFRLLYEQSGYEQIPAVEEKCFEQEINYFDETLRAANPFIVYHQVFKVFDAGEADGKKDDGWWRTPEGGRAGWIDLYRLFEGEIRINYTHWLALQALFPED